GAADIDIDRGLSSARGRKLADAQTPPVAIDDTNLHASWPADGVFVRDAEHGLEVAGARSIEHKNGHAAPRRGQDGGVGHNWCARDRVGRAIDLGIAVQHKGSGLWRLRAR